MEFVWNEGCENAMLEYQFVEKDFNFWAIENNEFDKLGPLGKDISTLLDHYKVNAIQVGRHETNGVVKVNISTKGQKDPDQIQLNQYRRVKINEVNDFNTKIRKPNYMENLQIDSIESLFKEVEDNGIYVEISLPQKEGRSIKRQPEQNWKLIFTHDPRLSLFHITTRPDIGMRSHRYEIFNLDNKNSIGAFFDIATGIDPKKLEVINQYNRDYFNCKMLAVIFYHDQYVMNEKAAL